MKLRSRGDKQRAGEEPDKFSESALTTAVQRCWIDGPRTIIDIARAVHIVDGVILRRVKGHFQAKLKEDSIGGVRRRIRSMSQVCWCAVEVSLGGQHLGAYTFKTSSPALVSRF